MKNPFRRSSGAERKSQDDHSARHIKIDPLETTIQYLAGETERLEDRAAVLGELGILGATKGLTPDVRESLADAIMQERLDPGQRNSRKD